MKKSNSTSMLNNVSKTFLIAVVLLIALGNVVALGQPAAYTAQVFNANIPGIPTPTAGANFRTPTVDWSQGKITGVGIAPNDFQWVNTSVHPTASNQNIAGFPAGAGFVRYINRTTAYPSVSGAVIGDAAFLASRLLDWSGHTAYSAFTDTIGISVWRDNTPSVINVLDYIEVYVNTSPSLNGATLALTTGGANKIHRSTTQAPVAAVPNAWNRYHFVIPNETRFWAAGTGGTSSAYVIVAAYSAGGNNIYIDNINLPQWQTNMQVTGASVIVAMNNEVGKNTTDNLMMGIQVTTKGSLNPKKIDGMLFSSTGSTSFATDVVQPNGPKCWYTGGGISFATTLGAVSVPKVSPSTPSYTNATLHFGWLSGTTGCPLATTPATVNFSPGNENFVWLAYDIAVGAVPGNNVAANFEQLFTSWTAAGCTGDTIITTSGIQVPASVAAFTPAPSVSAVRPIAGNLVYNIPNYSAGTSGPGGGYYNNDFVSVVYFPGENGTMIDNYFHDAMCASCVAVSGPYCNRHACHPADYTQFKPQNIGVFQKRIVEVSQGWGVRKGGAGYVLRANCGTWFSSNTIGIFIDWNKDGDFDDRYQGTTAVPAQNGFIYENYGSKTQVNANMSVPAVWNANSSWIIDVPLPTDIVTDLNQGQPCSNCVQDIGPIIVGDVRMRVREVYAAPSSPPGTIGVHPTNSGYSLGEVEDYTIFVLPDCPSTGSNVCKWVGASNDWSDPNNWCPALPTKNDVAFINTGTQFMPVISDNTTAECRNLRIMPGASLGINATKNSSLKVYDDLEIGAGATLGTGSNLAVTSDLIKTITIPGKSSVPPAGLALATITPFRATAQSKTQIAYTANELQNTYGWKAGDIIDQISIEVNSITGGAGASTYQNLRIRAFLTSGALSFPFPPPPNTKIAVEAGDPSIVAGYPIIFPQQTVLLNMPNASGGTQANGNYHTFVLPNTLPTNTLIWDGFSNLVLSIENWTQNGLAPAKSYVLYDEPNGVFNTLVVNGSVVSAGVINGYTIDGAGHYSGGSSGTVTAIVSNNRPRLDFKFHRPYNQFPITVCGDWINNNRNIRTMPYGTTPVYGIPGDSGFIAGNSRVIFDPTGRGNVNSPGLVVSNPTYYPGIPGATLPADVNQDITSAATNGGSSTVFGVLQINKASVTNKAVRQVSTFNPYLIGHYADTLVLSIGELNLNRKEFILRKPGASALSITGLGWLRSEDYGGGSPGTIESKFTWKIGSGTTGNYAIPFKNKTTGTGIFNLKYVKNTAADNIGDLTVGTYSTALDNTPYTFPLLPVGNPLHVNAMLTDPSPVLDATPWTVDRFWFVRRSTTTALTTGSTISFEYDNAVEGTLTSAYVAGEMKAQRYQSSPSDTGWHAPFAGQTDGVASGNIKVVSHPAKYIHKTYNIWAIVHITAIQPPLGGGCTAAQPTVTANGPLTFCPGQNVILTSTAANAYLWSNGATTQNLTVSLSGTYEVTITDGNGCQAVSAPVIVTATCPKPAGLSTTNITSGSAKTNWGAVGCATAYKLQYRVTGNTAWTTKNPTANFRNNTGLQSSTQYDWRVSTKCPDGSFSAYTAIQHFTTLVLKAEDLSISMNEINCSLFPNPTTGKTKLVFTLDKEQTVEINLLNMVGEKVMMLSSGMQTAGEKELEFDVNQISEGIYFVELITPEKQLRKKLIVIK